MAMAKMLKPITAGRNCNFGIQPSQRKAPGTNPVSSRLIPEKNSSARVIRIFFIQSIIIMQI